jgi:putative protease
MSEKIVGKVVNYYSKINVAAIKVVDDCIAIGDTIRIKGATTDITQKVESLEIDKKPVKIAETGASVGIKVKERVRPNDTVYKVY